MKKSGFRMHGIQTWIALPKEHEETAPSFEHVEAAKLPAWSAGGASLRLLVGTYDGRIAPTTHFSPIFYVAVEMAAAGRIAISPEHVERAVYIAEGTVVLGDRQLGIGDMAVLAAGTTPDVLAGAEGAKLMLAGGAPLDGPRHLWWNFVASSPERIERAKADWKEGRFGTVPGESEFIPLPER
jgi:redox-sensitive bicupin YhaK (pirin superfamily)